MTWVKLDTGFFHDPKVLRLSHSARLLYLAGLCHSGDHLTDGLLEAATIPLLHFQAGTTDSAIDELTAAELWTHEPEGFRVANFLAHQTSRETVLRQREEGKERARRSRERRAKSQRTYSEVTRPDTDTDTENKTPRHSSYPQPTDPRSRLCDECGALMSAHLIGCSHAAVKA